jgi:hypothetical protein
MMLMTTTMITCVAAVSSSDALLAFALGINSCVAIRRARDASSAIFVAVATLLLVALLATVRAHQRAGHGDDDRRRRRTLLKAAAWVLSLALTVMFAHRVAALAPAPLFAGAVWSMAAAAVGGGFCLLFLHDAGVVLVPVLQQGA